MHLFLSWQSIPSIQICRNRYPNNVPANFFNFIFHTKSIKIIFCSVLIRASQLWAMTFDFFRFFDHWTSLHSCNSCPSALLSAVLTLRCHIDWIYSCFYCLCCSVKCFPPLLIRMRVEIAWMKIVDERNNCHYRFYRNATAQWQIQSS